MENISKELRRYVRSLPEEQLFTYADLPVPKSEKVAVTQTMYRLVKEGAIKKLKKGVFYRPAKGYDGKSRLINPHIVIESYLKANGNRRSYVTGITTYNALGLTTQHPFVLEVASYSSLPKLEYHGSYLRIKPVKSYVEVTDTNWQYLQFLDLLRYFPVRHLDLNRENVIRYFVVWLKKVRQKERREIVELALSYPPRIRAFLGALLEEGEMSMFTKPLMESLNPTSSYKLHTRRYYLPTAKKWNLYDDFARKQSTV